MPWRSRVAEAVEPIKSRLKKCAKSGERPVIPTSTEDTDFLSCSSVGLSLLLNVGYGKMLRITLPRRGRYFAAGVCSYCALVGPKTRLGLCPFSRTIYIRHPFIERLKILSLRSPTCVFSPLFFNQIYDHGPQMNAFILRAIQGLTPQPT